MNSNERVEKIVSLHLRIRVIDGVREGRHDPQTDCNHRGDNDMGFGFWHSCRFIGAPDREPLSKEGLCNLRSCGHDSNSKHVLVKQLPDERGKHS